MYLYRTKLYYDTTNVKGESPTNATDLADFDVPAKKGTCLAVNSLELAETTFVIEDSYATFDGRINGTTITWANVKCVDTGNAYILYLITNTPI